LKKIRDRWLRIDRTDLKRLLSQLRRGVIQLFVAHPILLKMSTGVMMLSYLTTRVKAQDVFSPVFCDAPNNPIEGSDGKGVFTTGIFKVTLRNISDGAVAVIFDIIWHGNNYASNPWPDPDDRPGWWGYVLENFQKNFAPYGLNVDITDEDQHAPNVLGRFLFSDSCTNELGGYNVLIIKESSDIAELDILNSVYPVLLGHPSIPNEVDAGALCCKPRPPLNVDKSILIFTAGVVSGFAGGVLTSVAAGVLINCILNRFKVREKLVGLFKGHQSNDENTALSPESYPQYDKL
jgi:hypothetical protein